MSRWKKCSVLIELAMYAKVKKMLCLVELTVHAKVEKVLYAVVTVSASTTE